MKPTKNRYFCTVCKKTKMLFATKKKAYNFLKYNKKEILQEHGYAPVRSYRCDSCDGWHVTSRPYPKRQQPKVKVVVPLQVIKIEKVEVKHSLKDFREIMGVLASTISQLQRCRRQKEYERCSRLLDKGFRLLKRAKSYGGRNLRRDAMGKCLRTIHHSLLVEVA